MIIYETIPSKDQKGAKSHKIKKQTKNINFIGNLINFSSNQLTKSGKKIKKNVLNDKLYHKNYDFMM